MHLGVSGILTSVKIPEDGNRKQRNKGICSKTWEAPSTQHRDHTTAGKQWRHKTDKKEDKVQQPFDLI